MTKISDGITATLQDLESENRELRAEVERLRLAGNEFGSVAEELLRLSDREELPFLPAQDLDVCLARWREATR